MINSTLSSLVKASQVMVAEMESAEASSFVSQNDVSFRQVERLMAEVKADNAVCDDLCAQVGTLSNLVSDAKDAMQSVCDAQEAYQMADMDYHSAEADSEEESEADQERSNCEVELSDSKLQLRTASNDLRNLLDVMSEMVQPSPLAA
tara:strand:+ start:2096 stop:2539 length:444 start_codon:yes stop_codon:yes gene_type:complete